MTERRTAAQGLWRTVRDGAVRLNRLIAETNAADEAVFSAPSAQDGPRADVERRIAKARKERTCDARKAI